MKLALATAIAAMSLDEDLEPLQQACLAAGIDAQVLAWDDPTVSWSRFDAVLLRSTWDYVERIDEFLAWARACASQTRLLNPPDVVTWPSERLRVDGHQVVGPRGASIRAASARSRAASSRQPSSRASFACDHSVAQLEDAIEEGAAAHEVHADVVAAVDPAHLVDAHDVGMPQIFDDLCLALEPGKLI